MSTAGVHVVFKATDVEFGPMRDAERYVRERGWSIGPSDVTRVRGVLFSPGVSIAKWKNLTTDERMVCDAVLVGSGRTGPLRLLSMALYLAGVGES